MTDVVSPKKRSEMMSGIQGKDTRPEVLIRKSLHRKGFRYKIHDKTLPGKPDLVFPKYGAVIQINGCFWHAHDCHLFKWPSTRPDFWKNKILGNKTRDKRTLKELEILGWRVLIVWECAIKGKHKRPIDEITRQISAWLYSDESFKDICFKIDETNKSIEHCVCLP